MTIKFYGSRTPELNPAWLDALMDTANSPTGLYIVPEPAQPATRPDRDRDLAV